MPEDYLTIREAIMQAPENQLYSQAGIEPLFTAPKTARLVIVGQAPGLATQEAGRPWDDRSGDRLRDWLGMDTRPSMIQTPWLFSQWTSIILVKENRVTCHRARISLLSGIHEF